MNRRKHQVADAIQQHVDSIMRREMRDPRVGMVTITRVNVSDDLHNATIFISVLGDQEEELETLQALRHAEGFFRRELAHRLKMRYVPQVHFALDQALEEAMRVYELLDSLDLPPAGESTNVNEEGPDPIQGEPRS